MSPLFAALPPADLPTVAYQPTALHAAELLASTRSGTHTVRSGDTVYDIAAKYDVSTREIVRVNNLKDGGRWIMPGDRLVIPGQGNAAKSGKSPAKSTAPQSSTRSSGQKSTSTGGTITVRAGDTLSGIAHRHGTTIAALASANKINAGSFIYPGQKLTLPGTKATSTSGSQKAGSNSSSQKSSGQKSTSTGGTITVRAGDTLSGIAHRHGTTIAALASANKINAGSFIYPGQKLTLPGTKATSGSGSQRSGGQTAPSRSADRDRPWDATNIGSYKVGEDVDDTFLHYRYSSATARAAAANREYLADRAAPSRDEIRSMIVDASRRHGVDSKLMLALSFQESGWNQRAVSPANAIGAMQVIPTSGQWASNLVGRQLNLLDARDNVEAGVVIMKSLLGSAGSRDNAIGAYYQGLGNVRSYGLFPDTKRYVANIKYYMTTL